MGFLLVTLAVSSVFGKTESKSSDHAKIIGSILKSALETYHFKKLKVNDELSKNAFQEYIKKIDYGKQFLLAKDVEELRKNYETKLDDYLTAGQNPLVSDSLKLISNQVRKLDQYRSEVFASPLNVMTNDVIELNPEKRNFCQTEEELKALWRKIFTQSVLGRYFSLRDEQEDQGKDKKTNKVLSQLRFDEEEIDKKEAAKTENPKDKNKKVKKLSDQELLVKAQEAIAKKYEKLFHRLLKDNQDDYLENFYNSITGVFDPHTAYLAEKKKEDFDIDISGSLEGIGAVLQEDGPHIKVVKIVPGGAAWRQKELEMDDLILMVSQGKGDPVDLYDMRVDEAVRYIRGKKGTEVRLHVKKVDGSRKIVRIVRDVVQVGESFAKSSVIYKKSANKKIGYIKLPKFYRDFSNGERTCTDDVKKELKLFQEQKVDGVILDLRNNGGGALEDARGITGLFIEKGPVVQVKNHTGEVNVLQDDDSEVAYSGPLVVLINRFSASASEIVAGALQDYGRAVVVGGEFSHGKGTVQAVVPLGQGPLLSMLGSNLGALKVTIQIFYRVTGNSTQFKGITPDIIIPDPLGYVDKREKDLDYAIGWDQIPAQKFQLFSKSYPLDKLKIQSEQRIKNDKRIQKIVETLNY